MAKSNGELIIGITEACMIDGQRNGYEWLHMNEYKRMVDARAQSHVTQCTRGIINDVFVDSRKPKGCHGERFLRPV